MVRGQGVDDAGEQLADRARGRPSKQVVAVVQFDEALARRGTLHQLRLIASARNTTTGRIPDDVARCGLGGGCPGEPNLLSWSVMQLHNSSANTSTRRAP